MENGFILDGGLGFDLGNGRVRWRVEMWLKFGIDKATIIGNFRDFILKENS